MKQVYQIVLATFAMLFASVALATTGVTPDPEVPDWFYTGLGIVTAAAGLVAHVDPQISEEFKSSWPWWVRWLWNRAAGNYKHSQNIGSA